MPHPIMFDDADPLLERLREVCLAMPGAAEKVTHGRPNFYTRKVFASFGGVVKGSHDDPLLARALLFLPDPEDAMALDQDPRVHVPAYWGPSGWRALPLDLGPGGQPDPTGGGTDWAEIAELVDSSYRLTAGKRLVAELDARRG